MLIGNVLIKKYRAPIYGTPLWIVVSNNIITSIDTIEDIVDHRIITKANRKSTDAYMYAYSDHDGITRVLIFLHHKTGPGRIAHEAKHAVNVILGWNGVKPSFTNDEAECYYLEQIVDKIHDTIKYYNKKCGTV